MFRIPRQSYTEEFKREAVKLVEDGLKPAEVAGQLGISEQTLANWHTLRRNLCEVRMDRTAMRYVANGMDVRSAGSQRQWI